MSESYEQLRDGVSGEAGDVWRAADTAESNLRNLYRSLKEDTRYTEEHKAAKAWEGYEANREKIEAGKAKARELLGKWAQTAERLAVPLPAGESLITSDASKLVASQNEGTRIVRKLERASSGGGPFKPDRAEILKQEYRNGLDIGGMQGGVICRGVLMAADELGIEAHVVVDEFRADRHRESLDRARHQERLAGMIGTRISKPPFARPGSNEATRVNNANAPRYFVPRRQGIPSGLQAAPPADSSGDSKQKKAMS